jgi:hypothetical protein
MRNYVNLAVPTMPLLVADKRGAAETKIIAWNLRAWRSEGCRQCRQRNYNRNRLYAK